VGLQRTTSGTDKKGTPKPARLKLPWAVNRTLKNAVLGATLSAINQKNNAFELKCMDVIDYEFPLTNIVVFLYNPFFGEVMETVVNKITNFLTNNEYDLIILYRNPQCANFFDTHLLLTRLHSSKSFNIYRRKIPS